QYTLVEIVLQQFPHSCSVGSRQEVRPDIFSANRVGFCLLVVLALIVAVDGHRKAESDDESKQSQNCTYNNIEIVIPVFSTFRCFSRMKPPILAESHNPTKESAATRNGKSAILRICHYPLSPQPCLGGW